MGLNLRAVLFGVITAIVVGLISGMSVPFTDNTLPAVGFGLTGLIAGLVAGYVAGGTVGNGALNGGVATSLGTILVVVVLGLIGTALAGVFGLGVLVVGAVFVLIAAIPGAVGGAIGAWAKGERVTSPAGRPINR